MDQDTEVAYLLGNLMKYYRDGRSYADRESNEIARSQYQTIYEIMD